MKTLINKKKGVIFTMDSIFAMILIALFMSFIITNLAFRPNTQLDQVLKKQYAIDSTRALYYSETIFDAINTNSDEKLQAYFNEALPVEVCAKINIIHDSNIIISTKKNGCIEEEFATVHSTPIFYDENSYFVKVIVW